MHNKLLDNKYNCSLYFLHLTHNILIKQYIITLIYSVYINIFNILLLIILLLIILLLIILLLIILLLILLYKLYKKII